MTTHAADLTTAPRADPAGTTSRSRVAQIMQYLRKPSSPRVVIKCLALTGATALLLSGCSFGDVGHAAAPSPSDGQVS